MGFFDITKKVSDAVTLAQAFLASLFRYASSQDVLNLNIETVTAKQLKNLTKAQFNALRAMAIERQDPDLATLVIWSALCRKLGGTAKIVWSDDLSASQYFQPLKDGICRWIGEQNYASTSPDGSSSSGDPVAERKSLVAELFEKKWPILIVEGENITTTKGDLFVDDIKDSSGMHLIKGHILIFPSIQMITELGKIISSSPKSENPLIALSFTAGPSTVSEMVALLNASMRPLILPNFHDTSPDTSFSTSIGVAVHDLLHFLIQNRPNFTSKDLKISLNWINLIFNSVTALDLPVHSLSTLLEGRFFESYLDLEKTCDLKEQQSLFEYISHSIPPTQTLEPQNALRPKAAFRIITDLYLQMKSKPEAMLEKYGLSLYTKLPLFDWHSLEPHWTTLRDLLLRRDNPYREEVAHFLKQ